MLLQHEVVGRYNNIELLTINNLYAVKGVSRHSPIVLEERVKSSFELKLVFHILVPNHILVSFFTLYYLVLLMHLRTHCCHYQLEALVSLLYMAFMKGLIAERGGFGDYI